MRSTGNLHDIDVSKQELGSPMRLNILLLLITNRFGVFVQYSLYIGLVQYFPIVFLEVIRKEKYKDIKESKRM